MEFKDFAQTEASALLERLTSAAQAATEKVREGYEAQVKALRAEADELRNQLAKEATRAAAAEADLDTVIEAHKAVDAERLQADEARHAAEQDARHARETIDKARGEIRQLEDVLESEMAKKSAIESQLTAQKSALENEVAIARQNIDQLRSELDAQENTIHELEARVSQAQAAEASLRKKSGDSNNLLQTITAAAESTTKKIREEADAELAAMRAELDAARRELTTAKKNKPAESSKSGSGPELLTTSVAALEELGKSTTVADLLAAVVKQVAPQFPRVALFRVKGKHLEGERGSGLDAKTDVTKLVIPMSMDSIITRAANLGTIEETSGASQPGGSSPLGGTPQAAIALPIRFGGETLAVLYADSDKTWDSSKSAFATLLLRHTDVLLTRLTQELKTLKELRDYAAMLLQEAEQMFLADLDAKRPEKERVRRLQETIDCGRQLYSQRASLEGPLAAGLLDEQIEAILQAQSSTPFGKDLKTVSRRTESRRSAS